MPVKKGQEFRGLLKLLILNELESSEATGYELIQRISNKVTKRPSPGSIYPILKEMANTGVLNCREEGSKKLYSLSTKGKELLKKIYDTEKEAILNKIKMLKLAGVLNEGEAEFVNTFMSEKRMNWFRLYKLKNWIRFLEMLVIVAKADPSFAEKVISEAIEKLKIYIDNKNLNNSGDKK
jgi:DNA-binding PadR family transcriptional regulator